MFRGETSLGGIAKTRIVLKKYSSWVISGSDRCGVSCFVKETAVGLPVAIRIFTANIELMDALR
ncbi:MAG: hypothetical protein HWD58_10615 [Bacteroidota bacterium]|nr:MAG: hypothetical protein HWD58_10615 [Bacteroidota bacterium]